MSGMMRPSSMGLYVRIRAGCSVVVLMRVILCLVMMG